MKKKKKYKYRKRDKRKNKSKKIVGKKVKRVNAHPQRHKRHILDAKFIKLCKQKLMDKYKELVNLQKRGVNIISSEVGDEIDVASNVFGQEMLHELSETQRKLLDLVFIALEKINKGEYGICETCGKPIPKKRLKFLPWAKYCVKCQSNII